MLEYILDECERAECRSIVYRALSLGFRPPRLETMEMLCSLDAVCALYDTSAVLDTSGEYRLGEFTIALATNQVSSDLEGATEAYASLFGHTTRGVVPPYETEYGSDAPFLQPQEFSDIGGFFRAFGLVLNADAHERIDHISCQCEFMAFLCDKEAYACGHGDTEMMKETCKGQRLFLRDHLARFARTFGQRLSREDPLGLYGALGNLCITFMEMECNMLDIPVGPDAMNLRTPVSDDSPMACSSCTDPISTNGAD